MRRRSIPVIVAMMVLLGLVAPVAEGYIGGPVEILMSGPPGPVPCATTVTITATVLDVQAGDPIEEQVVQWSVAGPAGRTDRLSAATSSTNAQGVATIDLILGSKPGKRKVTASVTIVDASSQVACDDRLPQTSLQRPGDVDEAPPTLVDAPVPLAVVAGQVAQRVSIPRLGISAPIVEGDGVAVPAAAVAHYPGSAWPGGGSNVYLYGHARVGLFRELWRVRTNDVVELTLASGATARYQVTQIVPMARADDLGYLDATDDERLTLQTCLWYDRDSPRFIVIAKRLTAGS